MSDVRILSVRVVDVRFPTSRASIGSDAVNKDPDYSAAYCILETDSALEGHGLTFTLGRGTELCVLAIEYLAQFVNGRTLSLHHRRLRAPSPASSPATPSFAGSARKKASSTSPAGALINAVWDLYAKAEGKPVWRLLAEMPPEQLVSAIDFRYIDDALTRAEALDILARSQPTMPAAPAAS